MITLAITGGLYLFHKELDAVVHSDLKHVEDRKGAAKVTPSEMVAAALAGDVNDSISIILTGEFGWPDAKEVTLVLSKPEAGIEPFTAPPDDGNRTGR